MLKRYVHVPDEIKDVIGDQVGALSWKMWQRPNGDEGGVARVPASAWPGGVEPRATWL